MNGLIKKKLNLLVHLAHVDGNFHKSERDLILKLAAEKNTVIEPITGSENPFQDVDKIGDKEEILYLALKLIQADGVISAEELSFCRKLATKLGFYDTVVDRFANDPLPELPEFVKAVRVWLAAQ